MKRLTFLIFLTHVLACAVLAQEEDLDIYNPDSVRQVRIYFEEENWDDILDSLKQAGLDQRLIATVKFAGETYEGAGIRYKGNSSYFNVRKNDYAKLPFNIDVNETNKDKKMPGGYDKLKLSNVFRDPSFLREALSYKIANRYMVSPRANYVRVFINDEYFGLYNNTESVDEELLERFFGGDYEDETGVLFKCDPVWSHEPPEGCAKGEKSSLQYLGPDPECYMGNYEIKSDSGWAELVSLTDILNNHPEKIDSVLAVDEALWMLAFNITLVNLDSYTGRFCHNYYLYQDEEGVFHPIIWDLNLSFGGFRYDGLGKPLGLEDMQTLSPFTHYKQKNEKRPLITQLLGNDLYRKMYVAHIRTIVQDFFADSTYLYEAMQMQERIRPYVKADTNKLYNVEAFEKNLYESARANKVKIVGIKELMEPRTKYLKNHPLVGYEPPKIDTIEYIDLGEEAIFATRLEGATRAWLFYRNDTKGNFRAVEMLDDGASGDEMEADQIYGVVVPYTNIDEPIQYFIVAENKRTAALSPERASFEYHTTASEDATD
jgi:spore coat protein CotH